ncbi:cyclin-dependent kinase 7 [Metopolophium dirhodum]|uniref:cyclin-dependent kinase 7 n=1 Tax=Metopolophium dirhodum TaxID=44670 RepID=UPI0029905251|nr:cyclin-dependent kinase 7 [Metopolophium dirhodum]
MDSKSKKYEIIEFLGEGQFATVYKAKDSVTDNIVAVKKIKVGTVEDAKDGVNRTALREIKLLIELDHENIIALFDVFGHLSNISLVYDFMDTDLEVIIKDSSIVFTQSHIKAYTIMTLKGLEYLHMNWILHRDLKPNNLLVNKKGILKIADFGLAKRFGSPDRLHTHRVVTRFYRAPELLFGARAYGPAVDIWATGCIVAELLLRVPFLPGESDLDQLTKIFTTLGSPNEETWPGVAKLSDYVVFKKFPAIPLREIFTAAPNELLDVIGGMLNINPLARPTCSEALQMPYFSNRPPPSLGSQLPIPSCIRDSNPEDQDQDAKGQKRKFTDYSEGGTQPKRLVFDNFA